jgi:hypothetical protein
MLDLIHHIETLLLLLLLLMLMLMLLMTMMSLDLHFGTWDSKNKTSLAFG